MIKNDQQTNTYENCIMSSVLCFTWILNENLTKFYEILYTNISKHDNDSLLIRQLMLVLENIVNFSFKHFLIFSRFFYFDF